MEVRADYLVLGSGIAGLSFALKAAEHGRVLVVTKKERAESNTNYAQGGIAAVLSPDDSFELHVEDTLKAGAGLCHRDAVELVVREGPRMVRELMEWGVEFTKRRVGDREELALGREGGHSRDRIVYASDLTGREIERALLERVKEHGNIEVLENHIAIDLITEHHVFGVKGVPKGHITCWGAYVLDTKSGLVKKLLAKVVLLATGGTGRVYLHTTNPKIATGDGIAMVYRAGGKVGNLEFMQFHPTALYRPDADPDEPAFLISEAVIPVVPAAHYMCGGVVTDLWGRTSIRNLYATGEVALTGVHGANRLASNSLLEALVFSDRAFRDSLARAREPDDFPEVPDWSEENVFNAEEWVLLSHDREEIRRLMWDYVGIVRSNYRLQRALRRIRLIAKEVEEFYRRTKVTVDLIELRNLAQVAELIVRCALARKESRGLHYNTDYPEPNPRYQRDTVLQKRP